MSRRLALRVGDSPSHVDEEYCVCLTGPVQQRPTFPNSVEHRMLNFPTMLAARAADKDLVDRTESITEMRLLSLDCLAQSWMVFCSRKEAVLKTIPRIAQTCEGGCDFSGSRAKPNATKSC
eukprot:s699_g42.t1